MELLLVVGRLCRTYGMKNDKDTSNNNNKQYKNTGMLKKLP